MTDKNLKEIMGREWEEVRKGFYYPALPRPQLVEDIPNGQIDMQNLQVRVSEPFIKDLHEEHGIEEEASMNEVLSHEVTHFMHYPGSVLNILRMQKIAKDELEDESKAGALRGAFTEAQTNIFQVKEKQNPHTVRLRKVIQPPEEDKFGRLIYGLYQTVWEEDLGIELDAEQADLVDRLKDIDYTNKDREKSNLRRFCRILKDYEPPQSEEQDSGGEGSEDAGQGNYGAGESDLDRFTENQIREGLRQFAQECDDPEEFEEIVKEVLGEGEEAKGLGDPNMTGSRAGVGEGTLKLARNFYTALSEKHTIPVRKKPMQKNGSLYPHSHTGFSVGDSMQDLDPYSTPGILPGITKKWVRKEGEATSDFEDTPDSILVIDNSGSMTDPDEEISVPVLGATAISNAYLDNEARVAVYSFGGQDRFLPLSKNKEDVHRALREYTGGGTTFNPNLLEGALKQEAREYDVTVISDMDIRNLDDFIETILNIPKTHRIHLLHTENNREVTQLKEKFGNYENIAILPMRYEDDIKEVTMGELRKSVR